MTLKTLSRVTCHAFLVTLPVLASATWLHAEDTSKLDEELMESLDTELLDGLETIPPDDDADPSAETGDKPAPDIATSDEDAFTRISKRMHEAERMIPRAESSRSTKKLQKEIVSDLDKLIAELEQQCKKCQGGASSSAKPSGQQTAKRESVKQPSQKRNDGEHDSKTPAKDSTEKLGKDEVRKADMEEMKGLLKDLWGQLPAKAREQMLQSSPEEFLPKYEMLIEDYYRRLAEKQEEK